MRVTILTGSKCVIVVLEYSIYISVYKHSGIESNKGATDLT
jgi:hypothetical protein